MNDVVRTQDVYLDIDVDMSVSSIESIHCNQYETGVQILNIYLEKAGVSWDPSGYALELNIKKPTSTVFKGTLSEYDENASLSGNLIIFPVNTIITVASGRAELDFLFSKDNTILYSNKFYINVHKAAVSRDDIEDTTQYIELKAYAEAAAKSAEKASTSESNANLSATNAASSESTTNTYMTTSLGYKNDSNTYMLYSKSYAHGESGLKDRTQEATDNSKYYKIMAESYLHGQTGARTDESTDNSQYYYNQIKDSSKKLDNVCGYISRVTANEFDALNDVQSGNIYCITESYKTNDTFEVGANIWLPANTDVMYTVDNKWNVFSHISDTIYYITSDESVPTTLAPGSHIYEEY